MTGVVRTTIALLAGLAGLGLLLHSSAAAPEPVPVVRFDDFRQASLARPVDASLEISGGHRVNNGRPAARVDFGRAEQPQLVIEAGGRGWDWSAASALTLAVENPEGEAIELLVRVDDDKGSGDPRRALTGRIRLPPRQVTVLILPFPGLSPLTMGMQYGPPLDGRPLGAQVIEDARGVLDRRHVVAIRLIVPKPSAQRRLVFGDVALLMGPARDRSAYQGIVDSLGQYAREGFPGKVTRIPDLTARWRAEKEEHDRLLASLPPRDRFGGLVSGPKLPATGFFRTQQRNGRWWLVTPDGHLFFSVGIAAIRPSVGATYVEDREFMFESLPEPGDPLSPHYGTTDMNALRSDAGFPVQTGRGFARGRWFNFYSANLERRHGADWLQAWRAMTLARLRGWGFNTIGNWSEPGLWDRATMPYVVPITLGGDFARIKSGIYWWGQMPDPFDPRFAAAADAAALEAARPRRHDPYLIGYFVDNELPWGQGDSAEPGYRYALAYSTLAMGPGSPAKAAFVRHLATKYRRPEGLAAAWGIRLSSWAQLEAAGFGAPRPSAAHPDIAADLSLLTRVFANTYFRTVAEALKRHDPNHLYLGARFWMRTPEAVSACARHCDVVSFNVYERELDGRAWEWFHRLGKPAIIGEFQFGSSDRGMFAPSLVDVGSEAARGPAYAAYVRSVVANPDFVGCHWFQYADQPLVGRLLDGENHHIGFVSVLDLPYQGLVTAARRANLEAVEARAGP